MQASLPAQSIETNIILVLKNLDENFENREKQNAFSYAERKKMLYDVIKLLISTDAMEKCSHGRVGETCIFKEA